MSDAQRGSYLWDYEHARTRFLAAYAALVERADADSLHDMVTSMLVARADAVAEEAVNS